MSKNKKKPKSEGASRPKVPPKPRPEKKPPTAMERPSIPPEGTQGDEWDDYCWSEEDY